MPGVIDTHVHYRYATGYRSDEEDYITETHSALAGECHYRASYAP